MIAGVERGVGPFNVERFSAKFARQFKKNEMDWDLDPSFANRAWSIVTSCESCLDMLKATLLFRKQFPQIDKEEVRVANEWIGFFRNPSKPSIIPKEKEEGYVVDKRDGILTCNIIRSGLQYLFSGVGRNPGTISEMDMLETAYYLEAHELYHRLLIDYKMSVVYALEHVLIVDLAKLLIDIEGSSLKDEKEIAGLSECIAKGLGKLLLQRPELIHYYNILKVPKLTFHNIKNDAIITVQLLENLAVCEHLKTLVFMQCALDKSLIDKLPVHLETLVIYQLQSFDEKIFDNLPFGLRGFELYGSNVTDRMLSKLPMLITRLVINSCDKITDGILKYFPRDLTYLDLAGNGQLTDKVLSESLKFLTHIRLSCLILLTDAAIEQLPLTLQVLDIDNTAITDKGIGRVPRNVLELKLGDRVSDEGLKHLPYYLRKLSLRDNGKITGAALAKLPNTLLNLDLMGSRVTDYDLEDLPNSLRELDLSYTKVRGNFVLKPGLLKLYLRSTSLTDENLAKLREGLLSLFLGQNPGLTGNCEKIPRSVLELNFHLSHIKTISGLPPELLSLDVSYCRTLTFTELNNVPKTVKFINIESGIIKTQDAKNKLPYSCVINS